MSQPAQKELRENHTPPALRFSLRALFLAMAAVAVLFAVMIRTSPVVSLAVLWFVLLMAAHVLGNAWGTHNAKRSTAEWQAQNRASDTGDDAARAARPVQFAPESRLRATTRLRLWIYIAPVVGAVTGGTLWWAASSEALFGPTELSGRIVGGISCAVLGALFGFLVTTFLTVTSRSLREATRDLRP